MDIREKFIKNGIPYDNIDPEMIDLISVLNFNWGLKTKYCCYGHSEFEPAYVMFDESIKDADIHKLVEHLHRNFPRDRDMYNQTRIYKWVRMNPVMFNWILEIVPLPFYRKIK